MGYTIIWAVYFWVFSSLFHPFCTCLQTIIYQPTMEQIFHNLLFERVLAQRIILGISKHIRMSPFWNKFGSIKKEIYYGPETKKENFKSTLCICAFNNLIENGYYTMKRILRIPEWCRCIFWKSNEYICIRQLLYCQREISSCIRLPLGVKQSLARKEFSLKQNSLVVCFKYMMTLLTLVHVIKRISFTCKSDLQSICFLVFLDIKS